MSVLSNGTELDGGPKGAARETERFCVSTQAVRPIGALIRFVVGPDGAVVPDVKCRLPGRGVWVTASRAAVGAAVRRKAFARSFRREVRVAGDLIAVTERLLENAALDALAVAGKAGEVVTGFAKVEAALGRGNARALLHASDAAADGVRKIDAVLRSHFGARADKMTVISAFSSAQLDLALGRSNVVHAALLAGPTSGTFQMRCLRLERFRTGDPGDQDHRLRGRIGAPEN
jgi:predicted RNA-binding protein YlxR (DUF448 family)